MSAETEQVDELLAKALACVRSCYAFMEVADSDFTEIVLIGNGLRRLLNKRCGQKPDAPYPPSAIDKLLAATTANREHSPEIVWVPSTAMERDER